MTFGEWFTEAKRLARLHGLPLPTLAQIAGRMKLSHAMVCYYATGRECASKKRQQQIKEITGGLVTEADWVMPRRRRPLPKADAAVIESVRNFHKPTE